MNLENNFGQKVLKVSIFANTGSLGEYSLNTSRSPDAIEVLAKPNTDWAKQVDAIETPFASSYDTEEYGANSALALMGLMELRFMLRKFGVSTSSQSDFANQPLAGKKFLDVGVGPGRGPVWLSALGGKVTGFDATRNYVEIAKSKIDAAQIFLKHPLDVELVQCPAERFPFPNSYYDGVISLFGVLNHVKSWQRTINNIAKSLKRDGKFIFSMYGTNEALVFRLMKDGLLPYEPSILQKRTTGGILLGNSTQVLPANFPEPSQICKIARSAGLKVEKSFGYLRIAALFPKFPTPQNLQKFFEKVKSIDSNAYEFISRQNTAENILLSAIIYDGIFEAPITDFAYVMFSTQKENL